MTEPRTLAVDIGGSGIKAVLLDEDGKMVGQRQRVPTPAKPVTIARWVPSSCVA